MKELIYKINHEENWEKAQGMLEMLNSIYGTQFGFLNKRVVRVERFKQKFKRLDRLKQICQNIFVAKEGSKKKKGFRLLFPKQEKSNEEISFCENLTAMCEWAI